MNPPSNNPTQSSPAAPEGGCPNCGLPQRFLNEHLHEGDWKCEAYQHITQGCKEPSLEPTPPTPTAGEEEMRVRERIAEWMGWKRVKVYEWTQDGSKPAVRVPLQYHDPKDLPDFCRSLDAIASAEAKLTGKRRERYATALCKVVGTANLFDTATATARQRATALNSILHTIEEKEQRE